MKDMKITPPKGYKIDREKSTFEHIVFKEIIKDIRERIHSMKDVFELNSTTEKEFNKKWEGFSEDEVGNAQEKLIVSAYNQGQKPNWKDFKEKKYYPYFIMDEDNFSYYTCNVWLTGSSASARLCFLNYDNMIDATTKFIHIYKKSRL